MSLIVRQLLHVIFGLVLAAGFPLVIQDANAQDSVPTGSDSTQESGTPVSASVVARINDELRIELDEDADVRIGTIVTITWEIGEQTLDAGRAEVSSIDGRVLTARITEGEPNKDMQAQVWVVNPEEDFQAAEKIYKGQWPEDPAAVRELRETAVRLYMRAAVGGSPHKGARKRLRDIRRKWGFFDADPKVQTQLGFYYYFYLRDSKNKPERPEDAAEWYRLAAVQGDTKAMLRLASLYTLGKGVKKDPEQAHKLYDQAIALGDNQALYDLAFHYSSVNGHSSLEEGIRTLTRAAEAGHCRALVDLAMVYFTGKEYPWGTGKIDMDEGYKWFTKGVSNGCVPWLGLSMANVAPENAAALGLSSARGVLVKEIVKDSPVAGKLEVDDVILAFDDEPTPHIAALIIALVQQRPGETVKFLVIRKGKEQRISVRLGTS